MIVKLMQLPLLSDAEKMVQKLRVFMGSMLLPRRPMDGKCMPLRILPSDHNNAQRCTLAANGRL